MNQLIDEIGDDESHQLYSLMDTLGTVIYAYEEKKHELPSLDGVEALKYLMQEHNLKQHDLAEIGSQGVVSEIFSGKKQLNNKQIKLLAKRFGVSASVFI